MVIYLQTLFSSLLRTGPDMKVILDGEVCAWDSGSQCYLPFGNNANVRNKEKEAWLAARGVSAGVETVYSVMLCSILSVYEHMLYC